MICCDRLLLFTRYPEAGLSKTRLIPTLGAGSAARLQRLLTERIAVEANILAKNHGIPTVVHYSGGSREKMASWLGPLVYEEQVGGDLGRRMQAAFVHAFSDGMTAAVLVGSDIPDLSADLLAGAFAALRTTNVAIGPSRDGGYYLIGMRAEAADRLYPLLFKQIAWSTTEVFALTCARLEKAELDYAVMPTLQDIDTPEDLTFARTQGLL